MIKVEAGVATREPIPKFLRGLKPSTLLDLSWTDPALGVQYAAWWPEVDQSLALGQYERYGDETLTVDSDNHQVIVTRAVEPWSQQEIDEYEAEQLSVRRASMTCTPRQAKQALRQSGLYNQVKQYINTLQGDAKDEAEIEWNDATEFQRTSGFLISMATALGLTEQQVDDLFDLAATL